MEFDQTFFFLEVLDFALLVHEDEMGDQKTSTPMHIGHLEFINLKLTNKRLK